MAVETAAARSVRTSCGSWRSYHLFHHENRDRVVERVVVPVTAVLWAEGAIDRFFFIRSDLGGPHVRFRLRCRPGSLEAADQAVGWAAEELYRRFPSRESVDDQTIRATNRDILASDPHETDDRVHEDNSWFPTPFHGELDRYGGERRYRHSLDFFCLSSAEALSHLEKFRGATRGRRLATGLRLLLRQAWGFARSGRELRHLLEAAVLVWGEKFPAAALKGDAEFDKRREALSGLTRQELDRLGAGRAPDGCPGEPGWLARASLQLARAIGRCDGSEHGLRWRIGASHLHMTGNRLGFLNAEEVYLSRLLQLALDHLKRSDAARWERLDRRLRDRAHERYDPPEGLPEPLVEAALRAVAGLAGRLTARSADS